MRARSPLLLALAAAVLASAALPGASAWAAGPGILSDPVADEECGACHMPFPPRFLPKRSWKRIMAHLDDHFGGDASLDPKTRDRITAFYVRFGADRGDDVLRITETRWWRGEHLYEIPAGVWARVGSPANCLACHGRAGRGEGDDD